MHHFISIVVPFHNNRNEIQLCCESLLNQAYPSDRYEIIFVDNNSRDNSSAIVSAFPSIILLQQPVPGSYAARNLGVRAAKGQIIAFTDADCVAASDWLQQINAAMQSSDVSLILGAYSGRRAKFPASALSAYENAKNRYIFLGQDQSLYYGYTNNMAVRPSVFDQFGFFVEVARGGDVMLVAKSWTTTRMLRPPSNTSAPCSSITLNLIVFSPTTKKCLFTADLWEGYAGNR